MNMCLYMEVIMSKGVPSVTSAEIGFAGGFLGAGIGYVLAPKRYNLEQLLSQSEDVFEKAIPHKYVLKGTQEQKDALKSIKQARKVLAGSADTFEAKLVEYIRTPKFEKAYKSLKKFIPRARIEMALVAGVLSGLTTLAIKYLSDTKS